MRRASASRLHISRRHTWRRWRRAFARVFPWVATVIIVAAVYSARRAQRSPPPPPSPSPPPVVTTPAAPLATGGAGADGDSAGSIVARLRELPVKVRDAQLAADTLMARGLSAEALERLERESRHAPLNLELKSSLALLLEQNRHYDEASRLWAEIIEAQPREAEPRFHLAAVWLAMGRYAEAYDMARWYLEAAPGDLAGRKLAARICLEGGWHDQALVHLRSIVDDKQEDIETRQLFALAYLRLGQYIKAVSQLTELARVEPPDPTTFYNLALAYARQSLPRETIQALTRAVELFGAPQVLQWMADEDFKPLHDDLLFRTFQTQLSQQTATDVVSLVPSSAAAEREIGLMPAPSPQPLLNVKQ